MAKAAIDEFFEAEGELPPVEEDAAAVVDTPAAEAKEPEPEAKAEPEPKEPETLADGVKDSPDFKSLREAASSLRKERNDHKGRADKLEGELAALKAELDAARKPPPPAPVEARPMAEITVPNPVEDPQGYHHYIERSRFSDKLDLSEAMLRQAIGDDNEVNEKVDVFKKAVEANPALRIELSRQTHPYKWAYEYGKRQLAMREVGDDPEAWRTAERARLKAEIEAEFTASLGGVEKRAAPEVELPQSLGTARSAGPRNEAPTVSDDPLDDIFAKRRRA